MFHELQQKKMRSNLSEILCYKCEYFDKIFDVCAQLVNNQGVNKKTGIIMDNYAFKELNE